MFRICPTPYEKSRRLKTPLKTNHLSRTQHLRVYSTTGIRYMKMQLDLMLQYPKSHENYLVFTLHRQLNTA